MKKLNWVLQNNLVRREVLDSIESVLRLDDVSFEEVQVIPFSDELPEVSDPSAFNIFYGSTTLIMNAAKDKRFSRGVFFDEQSFNMQNYISKWGAEMLNFESEITTPERFAGKQLDDDSSWFFRPLGDDKSFTGTVMAFSEIRHFEKHLRNSNNPYLTNQTPILVSPIRRIEKEWRHFIVDKKVISSSRYLKEGHLDISTTDIPGELISFVEECCREYVPNAIFVMDTALCDGKYFIVECNCFNGTGFYKHDVTAIFRAVNFFLKSLPGLR